MFFAALRLKVSASQRLTQGVCRDIENFENQFFLFLFFLEKTLRTLKQKKIIIFHELAKNGFIIFDKVGMKNKN